MGQILHKRARTTESIRKDIQTAEGSLRELGKKFNVNWKTIQKWKSRKSTEDAPMGNGRMNSILTSEEEKIICETRKKTWLPLDDLFDILKPKIPKLSRSNLHRCLQYYGISRVPEVMKEKQKERGKFKTYEIGFCHIDITDFWLQKKKYSLFVAIDRVSKLCIVELYEDKTKDSVLHFLEKVFKFFPYKIHRILTNNGAQFTYRALPKNRRPKNKRHPFTQMCLDNGVKHKLTNFFSPQTNGQVERMNKTIKDATIKMFQYENIMQFKLNLYDFLNFYNCSKKLKALKQKTPLEFLKEKFKIKPKLFKKNPDHFCVGLNI